jgi:outer membrane usher protein
VSVPLGQGVHAPYSSTSVQRGTRAGVSVQENVAGTLGEDNRFSYGFNVNHTDGRQSGHSTGAGATLGYISPVSTFNASGAASSGYRQLGGGFSGGVVAYRGGVAFTPSMGQTMAIIEAKDAAGARVANASGLRVDGRGRALVASLTPFASNELELDPKGLPVSVELKSTSQYVTPTAGAVVRARFETANPGLSMLIRARTAAGEPLPFGAQVIDASGHELGVVAQGGRVVVRGLQQSEGVLHATWGEDSADACRLPYRLPDTANRRDTTWTSIDLVCE